MSTDDQTWKSCNTCKRPIGFAAPYYACSVSTCNRKATGFVFCSVGCWDAHVPLFRHRDAWADEKTSPTVEAWEREQEAEATRTAAAPLSETSRSTGEVSGTGGVPRDVLVVVSKLKHYIKATSGMNTSDEVADVLSERLRYLCDDAVERARDDGRKTVMARDFRRPG